MIIVVTNYIQKSIAYYSIVLTIKNNGLIQIFNSGFNKSNYPDLVLVNDIPTHFIDNKLYIEEFFESRILIELIWKFPINNCELMFTESKEIINFNFSNFDTTKVTSMKKMFQDCLMTSLDLTNFNTQLVEDMQQMFEKCGNLKSLNLKSFNTSKVKLMNSMFSNCVNLESIDLSSFDTKNVIQMNSMFYHCSNLNSLDLSNFNTTSIEEMKETFKECSNLKILNIINFSSENIRYDINMFYGVNENLNICFNKNKLLKLSEDTLSKLNSFNNNCSYFCHLNLQSKFIFEKNKCIDSCSNDNEYKLEYNNICYKNCPDGTSVSGTGNFCEKDEIIINSDTYNEKNCLYINKMNNQCLEECNSVDFFNNICGMNQDNNNEKDIMIERIKNELIEGNLSSLISNLTSGDKDDLLIKEKYISYQITSSNNQNNNKYENISKIILGDCEDILRDKYKIESNLSLIIFKVDYYKENSKIPIIGYEVFNPKNYSQLNLSLCEKSNISLNIPVSIDENILFKYNPNNEYYRDECIPYTTESGTDIIINDRQDEYNNNNMSICENDCTFIEYNSETKKSICQCGIKYKQIVISEIYNQNDILLYNFNNKTYSSKLNTMGCFNTLFSKRGILTNIGSYILIFSILLFLISGILFNKCSYNILLMEIENIIYLKRHHKNNININETAGPNKKKSKNEPKSSSKIIKIKTKKNNKRKKNNKTHNELKNNRNKSSFSKLKIKNSKEILNSNKNKSRKNSSLEKFTDYELNTLSYKEAKKYDKRLFLSYYFSLIRYKNIFIFAFFPLNDYNSRIIKIDLFFLNFCIYYFLNSLFFNKSTIHKIYKDKGIYNFNYFLPYILLSFIFSHIITIVIKYFSLSESNIIQIKREKTADKAEIKVENVKKRLILKYICFFIFGTLFLLFLWYYLSSFGAVYKNTQVFLIINTIISFGFSLLFPFLISIIPGFLRFKSFSSNNKEYMYKISKIIQII